MEKEIKICEKCKKVSNIDSNFCQYCGTDLSEDWIERFDKKIIGYLVSIIINIATTLIVLLALEVI